jgi:hypothetical protein
MLVLFMGWLYNLVRHLPLRMQVRKLKKSLAAAELAQQQAQDQIASSIDSTPQHPPQ